MLVLYFVAGNSEFKMEHVIIQTCSNCLLTPKVLIKVSDKFLILQ